MNPGADVAPYRAPGWLPGGHLQTIWPALFMPRPAVALRRERWETPDGDFVDLDWAPEPAGDPANARLLALFHGLEGGSRSHYAVGLMARLAAAGWRGVVVHFRGCSGEANRLPRAYHSGDSDEVDWMLRRLADRAAAGGLYAAGVSLGGNALLKWLGERGDDACERVAAACAVSAPLDLAAAGDHLGRGFNRVYTAHFLRSLRRKSLDKLRLHPGLYDAAAVRRSRSLRAFDNVVTAPLHGFRDTDDYWGRASSLPWLKTVRVPTLVINARNDPFLPATVLPGAAQVSDPVTLEYPDEGGHAGFVSGPFPGAFEWLPRRLLAFFADCSTQRGNLGSAASSHG